MEFGIATCTRPRTTVGPFAQCSLINLPAASLHWSLLLTDIDFAIGSILVFEALVEILLHHCSQSLSKPHHTVASSQRPTADMQTCSWSIVKFNRLESVCSDHTWPVLFITLLFVRPLVSLLIDQHVGLLPEFGYVLFRREESCSSLVWRDPFCYKT